MTIIEEIKDIEQILFDHKFDSYKFDTKAIMREALSMSDAEIIARYSDQMPKKADRIARKMLRKRLWHMPLAYITGKQGFMKMEFNVGRGVLIPRSDTEIVVEKAMEKYKELNNNDEENHEGLILDMCTGSGCIALSLAKEFPNAKVIGVDVSKRALKYANSNKELNKITNCEFMRSNLFDEFREGSKVKEE
ncbi:MAG: peptide chain release factor N(5)-glutamine methyltransferase [Clostridia bacterium]|nr:peptide chain release factor N(5)-glutamine methyltransferase [Clostridia bacterium]